MSCPSMAAAPAGSVLPSSCSHGLGEHGPEPHLVPHSVGAGRQWRQWGWGWGDRFLFFPVSGLPAGSVPHSVLMEPSGAPAALTHPRPTPYGGGKREQPESLPWRVLLPTSFASTLLLLIPQSGPSGPSCNEREREREKRASGDRWLVLNPV